MVVGRIIQSGRNQKHFADRFSRWCTYAEKQFTKQFNRTEVNGVQKGGGGEGEESRLTDHPEVMSTWRHSSTLPRSLNVFRRFGKLKILHFAGSFALQPTLFC